ncbi:MAG: 3-keto-5-aminohexanoate cleavage protein [Planctomycetia bacterium]|nr:3-keto-5-aminohexanoate cleavage protein [Planctomycetia bacterium]
MYFTDDALLPENMPPLMITAAPYGPMWMPEDCTPEQKLPVSWDEQVQAAVDCFNAGATLLHIHVRDPETGHISKDFQQYNDQIARLRQAVPKMILQMGGSISFAPAPGEAAHAANYDTRHKLCTLKPTPDQITVMCGSSLYDQTAIHPLDVFEDRSGDGPRDGQPGDGCRA